MTDSETPTKRMKLDNDTNVELTASNGSSKSKTCILQDFEKFELVKVLHNNPDRFSIALEGRIKGEEGTAVIHMQASY